MDSIDDINMKSLMFGVYDITRLDPTFPVLTTAQITACQGGQSCVADGNKTIPDNVKRIMKFMPKAVFDSVTVNQAVVGGNAKFLTYEGFLTAVAAFGGFCDGNNSGYTQQWSKDENCKREMAAFGAAAIANTNKRDDNLKDASG